MPFATILSPFLHTKPPLVQLYSPLVFLWFLLVFMADAQSGPMADIRADVRCFQAPPGVQIGETTLRSYSRPLRTLNIERLLIVPFGA